MLGPSWIALLEKIPATIHDKVALTLVTGAEILMQSLVRLDPDFAILRGRMSGSTDAGRVIVLPYDQIVNLAFTKIMLEPEVQAIFGKTLTSAVPSSQQAATDNEAASEDAAAPEIVETPKEQPKAVIKPQITPSPSAPSPAKNQPVPSKSILLARLRARLAEQGK